MKDRFSEHAGQYKQFRPSYPNELYHFLLNLIPEKKTAWDCGTGNGQVAVELARYFEQVYATDISEKQLQQAPPVSNVHYQLESAENTAFPDQYFDLITVAQAIHWFDFNLFYKEVKRTLKAKGVLAVMGYGLIRTEDPICQIIDRFYTQIVGPYWDKERKYIDEMYETIPFPFEEIETPAFTHEVEWKLSQLIGYLNTWSAVKLYEKKNSLNPIRLIEEELKNAWGNETNTQIITFPILLRISRV